MLESLFGTGKLERLVIWPLHEEKNPGAAPTLTKLDAEKFTFPINPDTYNISHYVNWERHKTLASPDEDPKFDYAGPSTLDFTIIFDGTGIIKPAGTLDNLSLDSVPIVGAVASQFNDSKPMTVMEQIKKFTSVVYNINEPTHRPRRVRIAWGPQVYDGVLTSMSLNYKLFGSDGEPLRVEIRVSFESALLDILRISEEKTSSPDLTHKRTVLAGDTLPLMTNDIYGTTDYYIEVAKSNRLFNFRKLKEGRPIFFPPAKKTAK
jgi:hypothetical protein